MMLPPHAVLVFVGFPDPPGFAIHPTPPVHLNPSITGQSALAVAEKIAKIVREVRKRNAKEIDNVTSDSDFISRNITN